jgi:hypothetical protein
MSNAYFIRGGFRLTGTFEVGGVVTDPTTITFEIKTPSDVITTHIFGVDPNLIRDGVGVYHLDVTITEKGNWWYRMYGTGSCIASVENTFVGISSQFE